MKDQRRTSRVPGLLLAAAAGAAAGVVAGRLVEGRADRQVRLTGSTLASPAAAPWVTDFLNAAYYARERTERNVEDLRLAFMILTTYWHHQGSRELGVRDLVAFHRAFGSARLRGRGGRVGTLDQAALLEGGARLLGDWFPAAAQDWDRRGWGIAFETTAARAAHDPEVRLAAAKLGPLTPPRRPEAEQIWHTYPPVEVADPNAAIETLLAVEHWPDHASELGRFTPLRPGGLDGQTFEIEVAGFPTPRTPVFLRAYVTVHNLVTEADRPALDAWVEQLRAGFAARPDELNPVPAGAQVHAAFDLVCHEGHFMGDAKNRLLLYTHEGRSYLRAAGTWDPMGWHLAEMYDRVGRYAQHAFWGMERPSESMLHQIALHAAGKQDAR